MPKKFLYIVRIVVTVGLLWYLAQRIDLAATFAVARSANPFLLLGVIVLSAAAWFFNALRWRQLLALIEIHANPLRIFLYNLIGVFYGLVLPGGKLTGDMMSAYRFMRGQGEGNFDKRYFLSVLIDRFIGFLTIAAFLSLYFLLGHEAIAVFGGQKLWLGFLIITGTVVGWGLLFAPILDFILKFVKAESLLESLRAYRANKMKLIGALLFSLSGVVLSSLAVYILSLAAEVNLDFLTVTFGYLSATLLIVIPVTIAGIGLREGGLIYLLSRMGASVTNAAALSVLMLAFFAVFALAGGLAELFWAFKRKHA